MDSDGPAQCSSTYTAVFKPADTQPQYSSTRTQDSIQAHTQSSIQAHTQSSIQEIERTNNRSSSAESRDERAGAEDSGLTARQKKSAGVQQGQGFSVILLKSIHSRLRMWVRLIFMHTQTRGSIQTRTIRAVFKHTHTQDSIQAHTQSSIQAHTQSSIQEIERTNTRLSSAESRDE
jgi:hypothetical protein